MGEGGMAGGMADGMAGTGALSIIKTVHGAKLRTPRADGWSQAKRQLFLDHLAQTCNVLASVRAAGMSQQGARALRRRDPVFAGLWAEALQAGYEVLETELLRRAIGGGENPDDVDGSRAADAQGGGAGFDADLAFKLLMQRGTVRTRPIPDGRPHIKTVSIEEVEAVLLKQLAAIERRLRIAPPEGESGGQGGGGGAR